MRERQERERDKEGTCKNQSCVYRDKDIFSQRERKGEREREREKEKRNFNTHGEGKNE